jgi:hypothetical protein
VHIHTHRHTHMYVCMYECMYVCIYIYVRMHIECFFMLNVTSMVGGNPAPKCTYLVDLLYDLRRLVDQTIVGSVGHLPTPRNLEGRNSM